ncbi:hypothetical protein MICAH_5000006 [Microcystis aeruginosa PCC 9809]|uniref:Uncharacterized protein n=1 Tax=Microcystis aeruginosa PCC 9809 TaxID=1160285 RepID=I4I1W1_MICAE|nr:hypothetical protein MICAH_5000006 [Microcystis aeruginosa PCC 9809]
MPFAYPNQEINFAQLLRIILEQVVIITGSLPFHSLKVPWPWLKPRDF